MIVYGVALLSVCLILGMLVGEVLGVALNVDANVGGVGIAMLLLVLASNSKRLKHLTEDAAGKGIQFWSAFQLFHVFPEIFGSFLEHVLIINEISCFDHTKDIFIGN